jgi:hypothetical protein
MAKKSELTTKDSRQLALIAPYISKTGMTLPKDTSYEIWEEAGKSIRLAGKSIMWWLGDWLVFGDDHFKDKFSQAVDATGYDPGTLTNVMSVCRNVAHKIRCGLSFEHHKEVAGLDPKEQAKFLDKAQRHNWTRAELRGAIADAGLRKKPKVKAAKRKTKKEKAQEQTKPTTELYDSLYKELRAAAVLVEPFAEIAVAIGKLQGERAPSIKEINGLEKVTDELNAALHEVLLTVAQIQGIEDRAAA